MNKRERLELTEKLNNLVKKIKGQVKIAKCDYYSVSKMLDTIKEEGLYKALKENRRLVYPTYKKFVDNLELSEQDNKQLKLISKIAKEIGPEAMRDFDQYLINTTTEFWEGMKKVATESYKDVLAELYDTYIKDGQCDTFTADQLKAVLTENEVYTKKYAQALNAPTRMQTLLGYAKKVDSDDLNEVIDLVPEKEEEVQALAEVFATIGNEILDCNGDKSLVVVDNIKDINQALFKKVETNDGTTYLKRVADKVVSINATIAYAAGAGLLGLIIGALVKSLF